MSVDTLTRPVISRTQTTRPQKQQQARSKPSNRAYSAQPSPQYSSQPLQQPSCSLLIIGSGSELRGDDAVGARVVQNVERWQVPQIQVISVHQLTPDLTAAINRADYVIFTAACDRTNCALSVQFVPIPTCVRSDQNACLCTHRRPSLNQPSRDISSGYGSPYYTPESLLALTAFEYGQAPQAWRMQIPAENFEPGETLSATAQHGIDEAMQTIERFLINYRISRFSQCQPAS